MTYKTTLELRDGDKISVRGIIREFRGVRPADHYTLADGQAYYVMLDYDPAVDSMVRAKIDDRFLVVDGEVGSLAPYSTGQAAVPLLVGQYHTSTYHEDDASDARQRREEAAFYGPLV